MACAQTGSGSATIELLQNTSLSTVLSEIPDEERYHRLLPLTTKQDVQNLLQGIHQKFVSCVVLDEVEDSLRECGVLTASDSESLSGAHLPVPTDKARHLLKILNSIHYQHFIHDVVPILCRRHYHIIPARFWRQTQTDPETAKPEPCGETHVTECLRCLMQRRLRGTTVADFLYQHRAVTADTYNELTTNHRLKSTNWTVLFTAFTSLSTQSAQEQVRSLLKKHSLPVPPDLQDQMARGFPCGCGSVSDKDLAGLSTQGLKRRAMWRDHLTKWKERGSESTESEYPRSEYDSTGTSLDTMLSINSMEDVLDGVIPQQEETRAASAAGIPDCTAPPTAAGERSEQEPGPDDWGPGGEDCSQRPVFRFTVTEADGVETTANSRFQVCPVSASLPETDGSNGTNEAELKQFFKAGTLNQRANYATLNLRRWAARDILSADKDRTWHGRHSRSGRRPSDQLADILPGDLQRSPAQSQASLSSVILSNLEEARSWAEIRQDGMQQGVDKSDLGDSREVSLKDAPPCDPAPASDQPDSAPHVQSNRSLGSQQPDSAPHVQSSRSPGLQQADNAPHVQSNESRAVRRDTHAGSTTQSSGRQCANQRHSAAELREPPGQHVLAASPDIKTDGNTTFPRIRKRRETDRGVSTHQTLHTARLCRTPVSGQNGTSSSSQDCLDGDQPSAQGQGCLDCDQPSAQGQDCLDGDQPSAQGQDCVDGNEPSAQGQDCLDGDQPSAQGQDCLDGDQPSAQGQDCVDGDEPSAQGQACGHRVEEGTPHSAPLSGQGAESKQSPPVGAKSINRQKGTSLICPAALLPANRTPDDEKSKQISKVLHKGQYERLHAVVHGPQRADVGHILDDQHDVLPQETESPDAAPQAQLRVKDRTLSPAPSRPLRSSLSREVVEKARQNPDLQDLRRFVSTEVAGAQALRQLFLKAVIADAVAREDIHQMLNSYADMEYRFEDVCRTLEQLQNRQTENSPDPQHSTADDQSTEPCTTALSDVFTMCSHIQDLCCDMLVSARVFILCACYLNTVPSLTSHLTTSKTLAVARDEILLSEWASVEAGLQLLQLDRARAELGEVGGVSVILGSLLNQLCSFLESV